VEVCRLNKVTVLPKKPTSSMLIEETNIEETVIVLPNMVEKMVRLECSVDTFNVEVLMVLPEMDEKSF
jgi:hypothetical protein